MFCKKALRKYVLPKRLAPTILTARFVDFKKMLPKVSFFAVQINSFSRTVSTALMQ